jgi:hypothetical protein
VTRGWKKAKASIVEEAPQLSESILPDIVNPRTYFGGDPVGDVGLHCTDMLLGIINGDEEISGLTIDVII